MSCACAPILVGVTFSVSEILLPSITASFPFRTMDYSPWSSKNLIEAHAPPQHPPDQMTYADLDHAGSRGSTKAAPKDHAKVVYSDVGHHN